MGKSVARYFDLSRFKTGKNKNVAATKYLPACFLFYNYT